MIRFMPLIIAVLLGGNAAYAGDLAIMDAMKMRMGYMSQRQSVLANNIANANTPHFVPSDLEALDYGQEMRKRQHITLRQTNPRHIAGGGAPYPPFRTLKQKTTYETTPQGNQVVLEEQAMKMTENNTDYQLTTNLYKRMGAMLRTAVGNR